MELKEIAKKEKITYERVRQLLYYDKICPIHNWDYTITCSKCIQEERLKSFFEFFEKVSNGRLLSQIRRLSVKSRKREIVYQRAALIKILIEHHSKGYAEIGRLMHFDHTSIIHLHRLANKLYGGKYVHRDKG